MVGVQDERDIQRLFGGAAGLFAIQHQQKIGGVRERKIGLHDRLAFADAVVSSHDHGNLRGQPQRFADVGLVLVRFFIGIVERKRRDRGAQRLHGQRMLGKLPQHGDDGRIKFAFIGQAAPHLL